MGIVNNAVYLNGVRTAVPPSLELTYETMDESGGMGWIGLYRPSKAEMDSVAEEFSLHHLVVEDSIKAHQRPKIERYGEVLFTVLRPARYVDSTERVEFGELHILTGENFVVTSRFAETPDLTVVRQRLEANPELLALGPEAVLYATLDQVVDEYFPVVAGLANDIDEIEYQVFGGDPKVSRRIYELLREVIEFQRATQPLTVMLDSLKNGFEKYAVDEELQKYLRDVEDHALKIIDRVDGFRSLLENILTVNATLVGQRQSEETQRLTEAQFAQSEEVKKISSWAAILFAPTLIAGIYGMNFEHMPELSWVVGYPLALVAMFVFSLVLYLIFKKRGWI
ncbi:MAG TPA: magnesium and cobalt transport protein CorA [Marmoricola sp.]|nr:magnesium and cobalt transport protein CorA [Marmoricola sp.]